MTSSMLLKSWDAAGELADGLHLLRLDQLSLQLPSARDVARDVLEHERFSSTPQDARAHLERDAHPGARDHLEVVGAGARSVTRVGHDLAPALPIVLGHQLLHAAPRSFLARETEDLARGGVQGT